MKIQKSGLAVDSIFYSITKVITILIGMIITKLLSVSLTLSEYGTYSQTLVIVSVVVSITLLGLPDASNYFFNSQFTSKNREKYISTIFFIELIVGCTAGIFLILVQTGIIQYFENENLRPLIYIVALKPMFENMQSLYQVLFVSVGKAKITAIRNMVLSFVKLVAVIIGLRYKSLLIVFIILVIFDVIQILYYIFLSQKHYFTIKLSFSNFKNIREILSYSLPMGVYIMTNTLTRAIDKLVISKLDGIESMAVYTNCGKALPFDIISSSIAIVLIPLIIKYISNKEYEKVKSLYSCYLRLGYYSVWIFGCACIIMNKQLIGFLYAPEYISGNMVFIFYLLDTMVRFAGMHLILTGSGNSKTLMIYSLASLIINTMLNICLYYIIGFSGPAVATLIVALLYVILIMRKSMRIIHAKIKEIINVKEFLQFVFGLLLSGFGLFIFNKLIVSKGINANLSMILTLALFTVINLFINFRNIKKAYLELNQYKLGK